MASRYASITRNMADKLLHAGDMAIGPEAETDMESALLDANACPVANIVIGQEFYIVTSNPYGSSILRVNVDGSITQLTWN